MSIELVELPLAMGPDVPSSSTQGELSLKPHSFPALTSTSGTSATMPSAAELQRESIEESLGLEEIDPLTYRSTRLWIPINARYVLAPGIRLMPTTHCLISPAVVALVDRFLV